ncbi:MAG: cytochrome c3 family protein [Desulfovibrio sp.]|nr:cytochrome c3 family protein [Desulfovibrio sp.]
MGNDQTCSENRQFCSKKHGSRFWTALGQTFLGAQPNLAFCCLALLGFSFFLLFGSNEAQSSEINKIAEAISKPMTIQAKTTHPFAVVFNHTSHKGQECQSCHHKKSETGDYAPCRQCHQDQGRSTDQKSLYNAFHSKKSARSCLKCHRTLLVENPGRYGRSFANCKPCHQGLMKDIIKDSIVLDSAKSPLLHVKFPHPAHKGISCVTCHHMKSEAGRYISCDECHKALGRSQAKDSLFVAYHDAKSNHSCFACHRTKSELKPTRFGGKFYNCRPCHEPPKAAK